MNELSNELLNRIYYLSALVSYPLCDRLTHASGSTDSIGILMAEIKSLMASDIEMAYLLFQFLMAISRLVIPGEIRLLSSNAVTLRQFLLELSLDFEDYYEFKLIADDL